MGVLRPKIEELAERKMRAAHPVPAAEWDAERLQARQAAFTKDAEQTRQSHRHSAGKW